MAYEENCLGRFLKDQGKLDKTKAGKMMVAVGKSMSYSGQQRLAIRTPLVRLYQEVETFHDRAIEDTYKTVKRMEKVFISSASFSFIFRLFKQQYKFYDK